MESQISTGRLIGGILLVAGCCIGAGMLGLPVLSAMAGFVPSAILFFLSWLFMLTTGLLFLEVNLSCGKEVSIVSMASKTLGPLGKAVSWIVFLFLFYCLMTAYVAGGGELFGDFIQEMTDFSTPPWVGELAMVIIFGIAIFLGTFTVDHFNRLLMLGLLTTYVLMVVSGSSSVNLDLLKHSDWSAAVFVIPILIISFGFHNLIPSLVTYFERDVRQLRIALILGSAIPLVIYLIWEWLILGLVPLEGPGGFLQALNQGDLATHALKAAVGASWVVVIAQAFAFFAIVTSFLGVALSFVDFLADGLQIKKTGGGQAALCLLVLAPPFIFSVIHPHVFLTALNYAGGFGAVVLFGILPVLMVWSGRYYQNESWKTLVPGGKPLLVIVFIVSLFVVGLQFVQSVSSNTKNHEVADAVPL